MYLLYLGTTAENSLGCKSKKDRFIYACDVTFPTDLLYTKSNGP